MAEIVNLCRARKQKARTGKDLHAAQNRALHGRSKAAKHAVGVDREKSAAFVEGHRREPPVGDGTD